MANCFLGHTLAPCTNSQLYRCPRGRRGQQTRLLGPRSLVPERQLGFWLALVFYIEELR